MVLVSMKMQYLKRIIIDYPRDKKVIKQVKSEQVKKTSGGPKFFI